MRVLLAPDKFKGSLTAFEVAEAVGRGLAATGVAARLLPLADGGEQQLDEPSGGRLRLVVGQPRPLVGLDEDVLGPVQVGDEEVQAGHRDADGAAGPDGGLRDLRVQPGGDVLDGAPGVQLAVRRTRIRAPAGGTSSVAQPASATTAAVVSSSGIRDSPPGARSRRRLVRRISVVTSETPSPTTVAGRPRACQVFCVSRRSRSVGSAGQMGRRSGNWRANAFRAFFQPWVPVPASPPRWSLMLRMAR